MLSVSFLNCAGILECGTSLCFTDQETRENIFQWNQFLSGSVLPPISCTDQFYVALYIDQETLEKVFVKLTISILIWYIPY